MLRAFVDDEMLDHAAEVGDGTARGMGGLLAACELARFLRGELPGLVDEFGPVESLLAVPRAPVAVGDYVAVVRVEDVIVGGPFVALQGAWVQAGALPGVHLCCWVDVSVP